MSGSDVSDGFEQAFQQRVTETLDALGVYARQAELSAESGKDAAKLVTAFEQVIGLYSLADPTVTTQAPEVINHLSMVRDALKMESGTDRTDGDQLSAKVRAMLESGIDLSAEITERAGMLLGRWDASKPKGSGRSTTGTVSNYTPVEWRCACGWVGHDKSNPNSARWAWLKHFAGSAHGVRDEAGRDGRVGKDHPLYAALTNVLTPVMKGEETRCAAEVDGVGKLITIVDPR